MVWDTRILKYISYVNLLRANDAIAQFVESVCGHYSGSHKIGFIVDNRYRSHNMFSVRLKRLLDQEFEQAL